VGVITIKGEGCKVDKLAKIAELTGGTVTRVNPEKITEDFANILKEELVARDAEVKIRLHASMKFRGEDKIFLSEEDSLYLKNQGNVTAGVELIFEYEPKNAQELEKLGIKVDDLKEIPMQSQITYTSANGDRIIRVMTLKLQTTDKLEQAE